MSERALVVLGTASQVPTRYRNHNGYFLRWDGHGMLFDPGEGTQRQMRIAGVRASEIHRILITHFHGDHSLGLPGICQRLALDAVSHRVTVHYPASGQDYYDRLRHASIYVDTADIEPAPISGPGVIADSPLHIETLPLDHRVDSYGYRIREPDRTSLIPDRLAELGLEGPVVGELQRSGEVIVAGRTVTIDEVSEVRPGQSAAFVMDTRLCENAFALARDVDLLICESTFATAEADKAAEWGHLTAAQAATIAVESGARRLVLTHFSQRYPDVDHLVEEAAAIHPDVVAAHDGLVVDFPSRPPRPQPSRRET